MNHCTGGKIVRTRCLVWTAVGFMAFAGGCGKHKDEGSATADPGATATSAATSTAGAARGQVFKVTPEEFYKEYTANAEATQQKYHVGQVEIAGIVEEVGVNLAAKPVVSLRAATEKDANGILPVVQCMTEDDEPWGKLGRGQQVTFRGDVGGLPLFPNLENCQIVSAGPPAAIRTWSFQLASEYGIEKDKFKKDYAGKNLIVSGKVVDRKVDATGAITLVLEGVADTQVRCAFGMVESTIRTIVPAVKVGQKVNVFGEITEFDKPGDVQLTSCRLVTK